VDLSNTNNPFQTLIDNNYLKSIPKIQSKSSSGNTYKWAIKDLKSDTGDISIEYK
jgi:hypothetical protein